MAGAASYRGGGRDVSKRTRQNYLHLVITLAVLAFAVHIGEGGFANSINKITENLDVALSDLSNDTIRYSKYNSSAIYVSDTRFNARGMAGLYNLTQKVMDMVLDRDFLIKDLLSVKHRPNGYPSIDINHDALKFSSLASAYWLLLLVLICVTLTGCLLPICGLCFCCCRCCCGKCGARTRPADKRRDLCWKVLLGTVLIALATGMLFCVVCAFASNQQLQDGINDLPMSMRNSTRDANTYLDDTRNQANHLLGTNFVEFSDHFESTLNKSEDYVMDQLTELSNATAMTQLEHFVEQNPKIKADLSQLKANTNSLRVSASQLNDAMRKVKGDLIHTLQNCQQLKECQDIQNNISKLETNIDFNKLPDVTPTMQKFDQLNWAALTKSVQEGSQKLEDIKKNIREKLKTVLQETMDTVRKTNDTIQDKLRMVNETLGSFQTELDKNADLVIKYTDKYVKEYGQYRNYGGLGISCVLLLITIFLTFGLVCGICGKRPDGYSDNCCNKGTGGQFLICAVMIMFIFGFVIAVVTIAFLIGGLLTDRVVCYPLRNPDKSTILAVINDYTKSLPEDTHLNIDVIEALEKCYRNETLYSVFNLENKFNIEDLKKKFNVSDYINQMQQDVQDVIPKNFFLLDRKNKEMLEEMANSDLSVNFQQFQDELELNFTNLSLDEISKKLNEIVRLLENKTSEEFQKVKTEIQLSILHIDTYNEKLLIPMKATAKKAIDVARELDELLRMNSTDFHTAIQKLIEEIESAQDTLRNRGPQLIKDVVRRFGDIIIAQVNSYINLVLNTTKQDLGKCEPLNMVIKSTLTATCEKILMPMNGFWVTLLLTLAIFIPTILVSIKLANLYQKYKPNGGYVETGHSSGGGAKRSKKKSKKGKGNKYGEDRPQNMGGEVVTREYAMSSSHQPPHQPDSRYGDMAPKQWEDFPNGGPPHYQRAPTEYERPPPYYYPGTGEQ